MTIERPYRIILVDDERPILDSLQRNLRNEDYEIESYTSSVEALEQCNKNQYDLMISDYKMPEIDGVMLLSMVKRIQPDLTCFLLTSHAEADKLINAVRNSYINKFMLKPWDPSDLKFQVARVLEKTDITDAVRP